jgi:hypothetical protein
VVVVANYKLQTITQNIPLPHNPQAATRAAFGWNADTNTALAIIKHILRDRHLITVKLFSENFFDSSVLSLCIRLGRTFVYLQEGSRAKKA